jgi:gentisate 1,2-dioxygenase
VSDHAKSALDKKPERSPERDAFYQRLLRSNATPLWEVLSELVPALPKPRCVPHLWAYDEMRPLLLESGELITAQEAERRVLILENPGMSGTSHITPSLYAGLQLVLPGETAATHRHAPAALRFVIESQGGYTAVDGERTTMYPGDFIVTPSMTYHDHGNPGEGPVTWMDVLDLHLVNFLDAGFAEHHPQDTQPSTRPDGDASVRYGANMFPVDYKSGRRATPVFSYPYSRSREILEHMYKHSPLDPCHGIKMRFVNPATGGPPLPAIATFIQLLPRGFKGAAYRFSDSTIFCAVEGAGHSRIGDTTLHWKQDDIFMAPSWMPVSHESVGDAVLFSASDRPLQQFLGIWREQVPLPS